MAQRARHRNQKGIDFLALSAVAVFGLLFQSVARAEGDPLAWLGGAYGMSVPSESGTSARPMVGFSGGAKIASELGLGAYYLSSHNSEVINGASQPWNYDLYGVMGGYFFEGSARGVYLGFLLGMAKLGGQYPQSALGTTYSASPMFYGALAGYDFFAMEHLSLGGELSYLSIQSGTSTVNSTSFNTDGFSTLNFLLTLKFWI